MTYVTVGSTVAAKQVVTIPFHRRSHARADFYWTNVRRRHIDSSVVCVTWTLPFTVHASHPVLAA